MRTWLLFASFAAALATCAKASAEPLDAALRAAISELQRGQTIDAAVGLVRQATRQAPRLGAAHLMAGDLFSLLGGVDALASHPASGATRDVSTRAARLLPSTDPATLRAELQARAAHLGRPAGALPLNVIGIEGRFDHVLLVDIAGPRLFVLTRRGDDFVVVNDFYASVGLMGGGKAREGDMRTPLGAYRITSELPRSRIRSYHGSFAWVLDYPNRDDRMAGRTGSHIWIHGVPPGTIARPPFSTEGCIALSNEDLEALRRLVRINRTVVVIVESVNWAPRDAWLAARDAARQPPGHRDPPAPPIAQTTAARDAEAVRATMERQAEHSTSGVVSGRTVAAARSGGTASPPARASALRLTGGGRATAVVTSGGATLRQSPRGPMVANVPGGTLLIVLGQDEAGWLRVRHGGEEAFVFGGRVTAN